MRTYRTFLILLAISLFTISCGDKKSNSSKKSKSVKRTIESKLSLARNSFVEKELRPMKKELESVLKQLNEYRTYEQSVRSLNALPMVELKKIKSEFLSRYGEEAKLIKSKIAELKNKISKNKETLVEIRKNLQKKEIVFNEQKNIVEGCFETLSKKQKAIEKEIGKRKKNIESTQNSLVNASKTAEKLAKKTVKKGGLVRSIYLEIIKIHGKYLTEVSKSLEQNRLLLMRRTETSKLKGRLKKTFVQFDKVEALIRKVYKQSRDLTKYANNHNKSITKKHKQCEKKQTTLLKSKDEIESLVLQFEEEKSNLDETTNELVEFVKDKEPFYSAYNEYKVATEKLNGKALGSLEDKRLLFEMSESRLVKKYSKNYLKIYSEVVKWITSKTIDGNKTLDLLDLIDRSMHTSSEILNLKSKVVQILTLANASNKKLSFVYGNANHRSIANFLGVKVPSINIKIDLPKIDLPKIKLPKIKIPKIEINLPNFSTPNLNFDLDLNIQEINLPKIEIANVDISKVVDIDLGELEVPNIEIEIPEVPVVSSIITKLGQFGESFIDDITSIEITVPKVEIVRIEADVEKDLKAPENLIKNTLLQIKDAKEDIDRELTNAYQGLKGSTDDALEDIKREREKGLEKVGAALKAAGKPENLARIAIVYTASVYGGPMGSALANSIMDKLENPNMSDQDMFNSFVVGAAAGYAAQGATEIPIDSIQSMPSAASAIARNLTTDAGNIILSGESYSTEQLLTSLASGAVNINTGEGLANDVLDSALNSGAQYAVKTTIHKEKFDIDAFTDQLYSGAANGFVRESVHHLMDEYVVKYIPEEHKGLDKKLFSSIGSLFEQVERNAFEVQIEKFEKLSEKDKKDLIEQVSSIEKEFYEQIAAELEKNNSQLTIEDLTSEKINELKYKYISERLGQEQIEENGVFKTLGLNNEERQKIGGRYVSSPALAPAVIPVLLGLATVYGVYETGEEALRIKTEYDKYYKETGKSPAQFALDYPEEFMSLSVDATLAVLPQLKVVSKILNVGVEGAAKVMFAAKKLGVRTEEGVLKLGKALTSEKISPFELNPTHKINPRGANYKKILNQLRRDMQMKETIKYIEVNGEKYIVDGHHRIRAAKELKIEKIPVEEVILPYKGYDTVEDLFL